VFKKITINDWRQYSKVDIDFHNKLTILTGANGAGKTTLFQLLNRHWGWNLQLVSTPRFSKEGKKKYWAGFWNKKDDIVEEPPTVPHQDIGRIDYLNGVSASISIPNNVAETFAVNIQNQQQVQGVYIPSHRAPYLFQKIEQIPTQIDAKDQIFQTYLNEMIGRYNINTRTQSPAFRIKSSLISLATFGYGNKAVVHNEEAVQMLEGFENILRILLPPSLGFKSFKIRVPDVLLSTDTGDFSFDAVSGGIAAIIDMSWQIHMYSLIHNSFVVVIDEPEAHLHPALQQRLLPDLLTAFPNTQFIIATHNPFLVTSVPDSNVYVLDYNEDGRVESTLLDIINKAGSANEILREVLGVPFTIPIWVESKINEITDKFKTKTISEESLSELKEEMFNLGLDHLFPDALTRVLEKKQ